MAKPTIKWTSRAWARLGEEIRRNPQKYPSKYPKQTPPAKTPRQRGEVLGSIVLTYSCTLL